MADGSKGWDDLAKIDSPVLSGVEVKKFLIVFEDGEHWTRPFLKKGFTHCWAAYYQPYDDSWTMLNPSNSHTQVVRMISEVFEPFIEDKAQVWAVPEQNYVRYPVLTCVEFVRAILGLSKPIFTPHQLYRYLMYGRVSKENIRVGRAAGTVSSGGKPSQTSGG